ncbi:hypothetical protein WA577_006395 [Blastocystis sp. JDR]
MDNSSKEDGADDQNPERQQAQTAKSSDGKPPLSGCENGVQTAVNGKPRYPNTPLPHLVQSKSHCYVLRPARVLLSVEDYVNCTYISEMMRSLCLKVGLMVVVDVFSKEEDFVKFLNYNQYDIVFIHQMLVFGNQGDSILLNVRCLLATTPVIIMGLSCNYGMLMSLCDFTAFLKVPFSESDFLHYLLKYVFEVYEEKTQGIELQRMPKKERLRYQVMARLSRLHSNEDFKVVGIPVPVQLSGELKEAQYLQQSRFSIPECFQIPLDPAKESIAAKQDASSQIPELPVLPVLPSLLSMPPETRVRSHKKRVSAGMKMVREEIDKFTKNSTTILTGLKNCNVDIVPTTVESDKSKKKHYVSIAPKL